MHKIFQMRRIEIKLEIWWFYHLHSIGVHKKFQKIYMGMYEGHPKSKLSKIRMCGQVNETVRNFRDI